MAYTGVSQDLDLRGRTFGSPAQLARAIYRARGWWPNIIIDDEGQLVLAYYVVGTRIVWRGMARWRQSAWRGDWAVIARPVRD